VESAAHFLVHPFESSWQDQIVAEWARQNPALVKRGESATEWEALEKEHKKKVLESISTVSKSSKLTWDYVNRYFDELLK
jgi:carboxypeptidase C (cathepsin A)